MILPVIHMNGSSPNRLAEHYSMAILALEGAIARLAEVAPNGRDYPAGDDAFATAAREHTERLRSLEKVRADLEALCVHCVEAIDAKRAQVVGR